MARLPYILPYDPDFLGGGFRVPLPTPCCTGKLALGGSPLDYIHYSVLLHAARKTAVYAANNVDTRLRRSGAGTNKRWAFDPRAPGLQTGEEIYGGTPWDRGHLATRFHVAWGEDQDDADDASDSTYYYSNAAPQHANFNEDEWLELENWLAQAAPAFEGRLCIFTGPLYTLDDRYVNGVRIPAAFWKVGVMRDGSAAGGDLVVAAFVVTQTETKGDWEGQVVEQLRIHQVGLKELGPAAGLDFGTLAKLDDYEWRAARFRDRRRMRWIPIRGPEDIRLSTQRRRAAGVRALRIGRGAPEPEAPAPGCGCAQAPPPALVELERQLEGLYGMMGTVLGELARSEGDRARLGRLRSAYDRILGGTPVARGEFDECVCVGTNPRPGEPEWFCTGVLVRPGVVLTAAHCILPDLPVSKVLVGAPSIALASLGEVIKVEAVHVHPDYDGNRVPSHDIAVLVLKRAAAATPAVVATAGETDAATDAILVGFGYNHPSLAHGFGTKRMAADVDVLVPAQAGAELGAHEAQHGWDHDFEMYVADPARQKDTCKGDSGGPAYIAVGDALKVAALTSRASADAENPEGCGEGGIYTKIAPYADWIAQVTGDASFREPGAGPAGPQPAPGGATPWIRAAMPNPPGSDKGAEWVELGNPGTVSVALEGYRLLDGNGRAMALGGSVAPGGSWRANLPADGGPVLANKGGTLRLFRGETLVHEVSYAKAESGQKIEFAAPAAVAAGPVTPTPRPKWNADPC